MPDYQPFGTYPDDINAVTCTVLGYGSYTATSIFSKELSIKIAKELEDRGIKAGYSKPYGLGGGVGGWLSFHTLLIDIASIFKHLASLHLAVVLRSIKSAYSLSKTYFSQYLSQKIDINKGQYVIILHVHSTQKEAEGAIGKRLMQLSLFAEHVIRELSDEVDDYKFTASVSMDLTALRYSAYISCAKPNTYYSKKLNSWILNHKIQSGKSVHVSKGRLNHIKATCKKAEL